MIKVLVVEDEVIVGEEIVQLLHADNYEVVGRATDATRALQIARQNLPDIAILDINIEGDRNGIELAKMLLELQEMAIIFLTAYDDQQFISEAESLHAHSYIIKPFQRRNLLLSVRMAFQAIASKRRKNADDNDDSIILQDRIFLRSGDRYHKVMVRDVMHIEAIGSYCKIKINGKYETLALNLKRFMEKVSSPLFVRVHRSYVVNVEKVDSINGNIICVGKDEIPLSSSYRENLLKKLRLL